VQHDFTWAVLVLLHMCVLWKSIYILGNKISNHNQVCVHKGTKELEA